MKIIKVTRKLNRDDLDEIIKTLNIGGIVAYPTDTCYGLGVDATNVKAIMKLRKLKERPSNQPISVVIDSIETVRKYAIITPKIEFIIQRFMPGPVTIVTKKTELVPDELNKNGISFRIPNQPIAISILKEFKKPITSPSANPRGLPPSYDVEQILEYFDDKLDLIVDVGKLPKVKPSAIIDMTCDRPKLIRSGPIPFNKIVEELKKFVESK